MFIFRMDCDHAGNTLQPQEVAQEENIDPFLMPRKDFPLFIWSQTSWLKLYNACV